MEPAVPSPSVPHSRPAQTLSSTGEKPADWRGQFSWALVEFARSPYLGLILIFVFPPYFANFVVGDAVHGQEIWGLSNTIVSMLMGALAPVLGAMSDRQGRRKTWLAGIFALMIAGCFSVYLGTLYRKG